MGYSREIYEAVQKKLFEFRLQAEGESRKRRTFFYKRFPRAELIEKEISSTAVKIARTVIGGGDVSSELKKLKEVNDTLRQEQKAMLDSVNLPEDYLKVHYRCEMCKDEGYIDGIMCQCMKELLRQESYARLNRLSPLSLSTFESFSLGYYSEHATDDVMPCARKRMSQILDFCIKYSSEFKKTSPSLLMRGATGLGKTHLSLAIANEVIKLGYGVIYISSPNMVSLLQKEHFGGKRETDLSEKYLIECDLLIIDDLGTEFVTSFSSAAIYNIVNSRIMMGLPTIMNTNFSLKELEEIYTQRMVSRIMGNSIHLVFMGTDIRQKKMIKKLN